MDGTTYSSDAPGLNSRNNAYRYEMCVTSLKPQKTDLYWPPMAEKPVFTLFVYQTLWMNYTTNRSGIPAPAQYDLALGMGMDLQVSIRKKIFRWSSYPGKTCYFWPHFFPPKSVFRLDPLLNMVKYGSLLSPNDRYGTGKISHASNMDKGGWVIPRCPPFQKPTFWSLPSSTPKDFTNILYPGGGTLMHIECLDGQLTK